MFEEISHGLLEPWRSGKVPNDGFRNCPPSHKGKSWYIFFNDNLYQLNLGFAENIRCFLTWEQIDWWFVRSLKSERQEQTADEEDLQLREM